MGYKFTRRHFLATATTAAVAPLIVPGQALGLNGAMAPSERIGIGIVGCGSMNTGHARQLVGNRGVQVVAVCDVNGLKRETLRKQVDEGYTSQSDQGSYTGCAGYNDFRDLIANKDVDALFVATPDHWHTLPSLAAMRAGKDVYCEKPMTLTIEEGRALADEQKRSGAIFQHGTLQRSAYGFPRAVELVRNGRIGTLKHVEIGIHPGDGPRGCNETPVPDWMDYDLWLGQAPLAPYCPERCIGRRAWLSIGAYGGGRIASWGSHHLDIAQWALDADHSGPVEIEGTATYPEWGIVDQAITWDAELRYSNGITVHMVNHAPPPYIKFIGDEGSIFVTRTEFTSDPANILDSVIGPDEYHVHTSRNHRQDFLDCVRSRETTVTPAEIGHRTATACHLMNIALRLGRKVRWNPETERFIDDPEANAMISRKMRAPWSL